MTLLKTSGEKGHYSKHWGNGDTSQNVRGKCDITLNVGGKVDISQNVRGKGDTSLT